MKHSLGKVLFMPLFFVILFAEDFSYNIHIDNPQPYLKEAVLLNVEIKQTNPNTVLFFKFSVNKSKAYRIEQITSTYDNTLHHNSIHNRYLIYPLKTGDISVSVTLVKRVTDEDKVTYFASGDRDDFKKLETKDSTIALAPLSLKVKAIPKNTVLVGDYTLHYDIPRHSAKVYEPLSIDVILEGTGYPPLGQTLFSEQDKVKLFTQKPIVEKFATKTNMHYKVNYLMALSSKENFDTPTLSLLAFNPKTHSPYTLSIPSQHFDIQKVDATTLVDKSDYPPALKADWKWLQNLLGYLVIFGAGYLSALAFRWQKKSTLKTTHPLVEKIQNTKDAKALLQVLMAQDSHRFAPCINHLEKTLYQNDKINLSKVKEEAIDLI